MQNIQHNCLPIPHFQGGSTEDPYIFKQKALDYMDDAQIPAAEWTTKFRLCLEGDAWIGTMISLSLLTGTHS